MTHNSARCAFALALFAATLLRGAAQEWTRFRGPNGSGVSAASSIPAVWTEQDINWKLPLPGPGHSSPVVWGDKVFVLTGDARSNRVWVICASASQGRIVWQQSVSQAAHHRHAWNSPASGSPAVDARRVYASWTEPERLALLALDHDGGKVWERNLGRYKSQHGGGPSPIVYGDQVIVANHQDGESFLVAVDAASGKTRWQVARRSTEANYSTPCLYQPPDGEPALIFTSHAHGFSAVAPDSGRVLWELTNVFDKRVISSPVLAPGLIIGTCGSGEGGLYLVAIRPADPARRRPPQVAYTIRQSAPYVPTPVCLGDLLFLWSDEGVVSCLRAATGEVKWQERLGEHFFSSPVCAGDRLFGVSTTGEVTVVRAGERFELLGRNVLGETVHSTPAVAAGRMYIHTAKHLICIGGRGRERGNDE
jgi:outer membrane protein assembly factor BamB